MNRFGEILSFLLLAVMLCFGAPSVAQDSSSRQSTGEVKIEVDRFGVGNIARRGEWVGIRLNLTDSSDSPRNVIVQVSSRDPDGDTAISERAIALNGGEKLSVWMYHRLGFNTGGGMSISVFAAADGVIRDGADRDLPSVGARVGFLEIADIDDTGNSSKIAPAGVGLLGLVGTADFDLQSFSNQSAPTAPYLPFGHEMMELARSLTPAEFPDRWHGLAGFDTIVWGSGEPAELRTDSRRALRDWIERGGHLIVILPAAGQTWTNENLSDLYDAMPLVSVKKVEGVDLAASKYLFTHRAGNPMPKDATIHVLTPMQDTKPGEASVILQDADGRPIVVRRAIGSGMVTWIGVDLNQRSLERTVEADIFWNRILGRRGSTLGEADLVAGEDGTSNTTQEGTRFAIRAPVRMDSKLDIGITNLISLRRDSLQGLLIAFVLFVVYWIVAGPVGYAILKSRDLGKHAWLGFMACSIVFTAIAWGGATLLRKQSVEARHISILDHVYGQPVQRATMWAGVLIPRYGEAGIRIRQQFETDRSGNSISAWADSLESVWITFPDSRGYRTPVSDRVALSVPARQTIKNIQVEWAGGPPWAMPLPMAPPGATEAGSIQLLDEGKWRKDRPVLSGVLKHRFPAPLRNIQIIVNKGQSPIRRYTQFTQRRDEPVFDGYVFSYPNEWRADEELDLQLVTQASAIPDLVPWLNSLRPRSDRELRPMDLDGAQIMQSLRGLTFFHHLPPPVEELNQTEVYAAQRHYTHRLDLSAWLTQPCVIILGEVGGDAEFAAESPIGLSVDSEDSNATGVTFIRWVYPLPSRPASFAQRFDPAKRESTPSDAKNESDNREESPK
jgi:hypothetical protein